MNTSDAGLIFAIGERHKAADDLADLKVTHLCGGLLCDRIFDIELRGASRRTSGSRHQCPRVGKPCGAFNSSKPPGATRDHATPRDKLLAASFCTMMALRE
jgi:hypothetical protein